MSIPQPSRRKKSAKKKQSSRKKKQSAAAKGAPVRIRLRAQIQTAAIGREFDGDCPEDLLLNVFAADVSHLTHPLVEVEAGNITFVDLDTHHLRDKPPDQQLDAWADSVATTPRFWWRTHGSGLRLVYCGPHHEARALVAALAVPSFFEVEIKRCSRHPKGGHPKYPGKTCGPIHHVEAVDEAFPDWKIAGRLDQGAVDDLLDEMGMQRGGRYDHGHCPIDSDAESDAGDCIVASETGIWCHRCASKGLCFDGCATPGFVPYTGLNRGAVTAATIHNLASHFVHWTHAQIHLREEYPNIASNTLRQAYRLALQAGHGDDDPRVSMVFNPDLRAIQGENAWFDPPTRKEIKITKATLTGMPGLLRKVETIGDDGSPKVKLEVRFPWLDLAQSGVPLEGYKPCRFVRGIALHEDAKSLQVVIPPEMGDPVRLLSDQELLSEDDAFSSLQKGFPGLDQNYLMACLVAAICADKGGRPVILIAIGPTGSGKGETLRLAASFLADDRQTLTVNQDEEKNWRQVGVAIEGGHRFLAFDEFLRRARMLNDLVAWLLQWSSVNTWRRLFKSGNILTRNKAAIFLSAGCVPDAFKKSSELCRRIRLARLPRIVPDWRATCGGDTTDWRSQSKGNARIANSILTHAFRFAGEHDFNFDLVSQALGLPDPDEGDAEIQREVLCDLYRHCLDEFGDRTLHSGKRHVTGKWVDAMNPPCQELLQLLLPDEDTDRPGEAGTLFQLQQNMQMQPWNRILGIDEPPISCQMRRHGAVVMIRFVEVGVMRGKERINEQLPPIPDGNIHIDDSDPHDSGGPAGDGGSDGDPQNDPTAGTNQTGRADDQDTHAGNARGEGLSAELGHAHANNTLRQSCRENRQSGNPVDGATNRDFGQAEPGSASSVSSAKDIMHSAKLGGVSSETGREGGSRSKSLAQLAERVIAPLRPEESQSSLGTTSDTTLGRTQLPLGRVVSETQQARATPSRPPSPVESALASAGFPTQLVVFDFETYFDAQFSLGGRKKLSIPEYVHDPRFHVHGLAIRWPDGRCEFRADVESALVELRAAYGDRLQDVTVVAHNASFDLYILAKRYRLSPAFVTDTIAMARHVLPCLGHALADLAQRFGLQPKGDALGDLKGVREPSHAQWAKLAAYAKHDADLCHDIAQRLLPLISRPDVEIKLIDHTVRMFTDRGLRFDLESARELAKDIGAELQTLLDAAGVDAKTARSKKMEEMLTVELQKSGRKLQMKSGKNSPIAALAKGDDGMKELLADPSPRVQALARARLAVKSAPQMGKRVATMIRIAEATGGVLPVPLKYCGAHTGRYSGDGGVNLQNLPAHVKGLATRIRGLLHAGEGHKIVAVDAAQIEARVLAWLAGQQDLVQTFANGEDVYSSFASTVFGEFVRKPNADDPPELRAKLSSRRQLGKVAVLGLGYQMGVERFISNVRSNADLAAMIDAGSLSEASLQQVHKTYRRTYARIPELWYSVQSAFASALRQGVGHHNIISFTRESDAVHVGLPSGRKLFYRQPEITITGDMSYAGGKVYGGLLVENIIQAISRDILVEAILALELRGYEVVLTVHDEVVLRVPTDDAESALEAAMTCLSTTPAWAQGLPLAAEGRIAERYGK